MLMPGISSSVAGLTRNVSARSQNDSGTDPNRSSCDTHTEGRMRFVVAIEEKEGVVLAEVRERVGGKPVALLSCASLPSAIEPLLERLAVATASGQSALVAGGGSSAG